MKKIILALLPLFVALAQAAEPIDLGQGLAYLRVHSVAEAGGALHKILPGANALVLDLRYATIDAASAADLKAALVTRPADAPLFVLVSPATPSAIAPSLASVLTLGAPGAVPAPKVVVQTDAATDRRAYDALDAGTPLTDLISGKVEKERFDEATLVEEFKNGDRDAEPPPDPDPTATKPGDAAKEAKLVDRVLQRAVHLHRALLALHR